MINYYEKTNARFTPDKIHHIKVVEEFDVMPDKLVDAEIEQIQLENYQTKHEYDRDN